MKDVHLPLARFSAHQTILHLGEVGAPTYLVLEGEVALTRSSPRRTREVARLGRGEFFGELDGERPASTAAVAVTNCTLIQLDRPLLTAILRQRPEVGLALLTQLSSRWGSVLDSTAVVGTLPVVEPPVILAVASQLVHPAAGEGLRVAGDVKLVIGRADPNTGAAAPDLDLGGFAGGNTVSRRHAIIERRDGRLWIRALARATNGTFVNERRLTTGEEMEVHVGDRIRFGTVSTVIASSPAALRSER